MPMALMRGTRPARPWGFNCRRAPSIAVERYRWPLVSFLLGFLLWAGFAPVLLAAPPAPRLVSRGADGAAGATSSGVTVFAEPVRAPVTDQGLVYFLSTAALQPDLDRNQVIDVYRWDGTRTVPVSVAGVSPMASVFGNVRGLVLSGDGRFAIERRPREDLFQPVRAWVWTLDDLQVMELPLASAIGVDTADIAAGGRFVVLATAHDALDSAPGNSLGDVFRYDRSAGTVQRLSTTPAGGNTNGASVRPSLDDSGARVTFLSRATNLQTDGANGSDQAYLWQAAGATGSLTRLSRRPDGSPPNAVSELQISRSGQWAVFSSSDSQLSAGDEANTRDVFVVSAEGAGLERVSIASDGTAANAPCTEPDLSSDGRFVVFASAATTLAGVDTGGRRQIFLHDRLAGTTALVSASISGTPANADCQVPAISPSGRFITFVSAASNLTADALSTAALQVFLVDRGAAFANVRPQAWADHQNAAAGAPLTLPLRAVDANGDVLQYVVTSLPSSAQLFDGPQALAPAQIPAGGLPHTLADAEARLTLQPNPGFVGTVAFTFQATDGQALSVPATVTVTWGAFDHGILAALAADANDHAAPDGTPGRLAISAAGDVVVFPSLAANLVAGDVNQACDIFAWNRDADPLTRISASKRGLPEEIGLGSDDAALSPDGAFVAFRSLAKLSADDDNAYADIYLYDLVAGTTTLVSRGVTGQAANGNSQTPDVSENGDYVVFSSAAQNLVAADTGDHEQIYLWERQSGRVIWSTCGLGGAAANAPCLNPRLSADGAALVFDSAATNLGVVTGDGRQVFVYWRFAQQLTCISLAPDDAPGDGDSVRPSVSSAGRYVAFESEATNLIADDRNGKRDIFVCDLRTGLTLRLNVAANGGASDQDAFAADLSGNGRCVYFRSRASNLAALPTHGVMSAFLVDRSTAPDNAQHLRLLSHSPDGTTAGNADSWNGALSATGRYAVFASDASNLTNQGGSDFREIFLADLGDAPNQPPMAPDLAVAVEAGHAAEIALTGTDADEDDLVTRLVQLPAHGQLSPLDSSVSPGHPYPTATYTPDPGYVGADAFRFAVWDGSCTVEAQVTITVRPRFALSRSRLTIPLGTSQGTIPLAFFVLMDPNDLNAALPAQARLQLLATPGNGLLADREGRVLALGDEVPIANLPLTYTAYTPGQFAVEDLPFRARIDDWSSAAVPLEVAVGVLLQTLALDSGWNLVSFKMDPLDKTPVALFAGAGRAQVVRPAWHWDATRQGYQLTTEFRGGIGYWLYVSGAPVVMCDIPGRPVADANLVLRPGWNLVGPCTDTVLPQTDVLAGPAWKWNATTATFSAVHPGGMLQSGHGYWLWSHTAAVLPLVP